MITRQEFRDLLDELMTPSVYLALNTWLVVPLKFLNQISLRKCIGRT